MVDITLRKFIISIAAVVFISGCTEHHKTPVNIAFDLQYAGQSVSCNSNSNGQFTLNDFRFYLHNIQLKNEQNQWHRIKLTENSWQNDSTVLLDFEDASRNCNSGDEQTNKQIVGLGIKNPQGVRFTLGVPFDSNHKNPLIAKAPLNISTMHWHWQSGYKFMRAEFSFGQSTPVSRRLHIGSLQCKGEVNNISHCEKPNRATYTFDNFNTNQAIVINLEQLINFNLSDAPDKSLTCMGNGEDAWCKNALQWAGLNGQNPGMFVSAK